MQTTENTELFTYAEGAAYLKKGRRFVYDLANRNEIEVIYLSERSPRITKASVDNYILRLRQQTKA